MLSTEFRSTASDFPTALSLLWKKDQPEVIEFAFSATFCIFRSIVFHCYA
jgi:hypothetical protein